MRNCILKFMLVAAVVTSCGIAFAEKDPVNAKLIVDKGDANATGYVIFDSTESGKLNLTVHLQEGAGPGNYIARLRPVENLSGQTKIIADVSIPFSTNGKGEGNVTFSANTLLPSAWDHDGDGTIIAGLSIYADDGSGNFTGNRLFYTGRIQIPIH